MNKISLKRVVLSGIMVALVFLATYFTRIPIPMTQGYFNVGDTVIIVAAIMLGKRSGFLIGSMGSFLADVMSGYYLFAPLTLIVKGLEGYMIGSIASSYGDKKPTESKKILAILAGVLVMVAGYFIGEATVLKLFDETFGMAAAVYELPLNLLQGGLSAILGYSLSTVLTRMGLTADNI